MEVFPAMGRFSGAKVKWRQTSQDTTRKPDPPHDLAATRPVIINAHLALYHLHFWLINLLPRITSSTFILALNIFGFVFAISILEAAPDTNKACLKTPLFNSIKIHMFLIIIAMNFLISHYRILTFTGINGFLRSNVRLVWWKFDPYYYAL